MARGDAFLPGLWAIPTVEVLGGVFLLFARYVMLACFLGLTMGQELDLDSAVANDMSTSCWDLCSALEGPGGEPCKACNNRGSNKSFVVVVSTSIMVVAAPSSDCDEAAAESVGTPRAAGPPNEKADESSDAMAI